MLTYPHINPIAFSLGPLSVRWYGLMYLVGFLGGWWLGIYRAKRPGSGWHPQEIADFLFYGALGVILLGLMASTAVNGAGADGLIRGNAGFFWKQLLTVIGSSIYAFGFTWVMLWVIDKVTPVRTSEAEEGTLDESLHGERAYE